MPGLSTGLVAEHWLRGLQEGITVSRNRENPSIGGVDVLPQDTETWLLQCHRLTVDCNLIDGSLTSLPGLFDQEGPIEAKLETVKISHPAKANEQ